MKNPNLVRRNHQGCLNPMYGKSHSEKSKALMSETQSQRLKNINRLLFQLREDQLSKKIRKIISEMQIESNKTNSQ